MTVSPRGSPGSAIVVGAGITGVAAALNLVRDGWSVTLIDREAPGARGQASFGNAGLLAQGSIVPAQEPGLIWRVPRLLLDPDAPLFLLWRQLPRMLPWLAAFLRNGSRERIARIVPATLALTHDTVEAHRTLARGTDAERLIRTGPYAYLFSDRDAFAAEGFAFGLKAAHGLVWQEGAAQQIDPHIGAAYRFAAVLPDHGWILDPGAYVAALADAVREGGGTVLQATVRALRPAGIGAVVETDGGALSADLVVLAAGAWSGRLTAGLGLHAPVESKRGYHLMLRGATRRPPHPCMLNDAAVVMTPMRDGLRLAGLVELGGTEAPPSEAPLRLIRRAARRAYPDLEWETEDSWMGHRPTLPDSLPMLGAVPGAPAVLCAFGSQHLGLTIGPRLGRLVADLAAGRRPNLDLAPYDPGRFAR